MKSTQHTTECNRPQPAINPQPSQWPTENLESVIDPSLRSIRNTVGLSTSGFGSVIDPSLRSIRNVLRGLRVSLRV